MNVPHDLVIERDLIGAGLMSPTAFDGARAAVVPADFHAPAHSRTWEAMGRLRDQGHPVEATTVADACRGIAAMDGMALINAVAECPASGNWRRYAEIIVRYATARRLIAAADDISVLAQAAEVDASELVDLARARMAEVEAPAVNADVTDLDTMDAHVARVPEGAEEPFLVPGLLKRGWRVVMVAGEGLGKMLRLDEPVPTPGGWATIGSLAVGDTVFDATGAPCRVTALSGVDWAPETHRVNFDDGTTIEACADHEWSTVTYRDRAPERRGDGPPLTWPLSISTTAELRASLRARGGHCLNHAVPVAGPIEVPTVDLPIDPYLLGAWLGDSTTADGSLTLNRLDLDIAEQFGLPWHRVASGERPGSVMVRIDGFRTLLRKAGLLGYKHVPSRYLRASVEQRKALLAGLMDTDGYAVATGTGRGRGHGASVMELTLCDKTLAADAHELLLSLGLKVTSRESDAILEGRVVGRRWRMCFQSPFNPFRTARKAARWGPLRTHRAQLRYVTGVEPCEPSPMRCITVDSPTHTYLASRSMVPTHNSQSARAMVVGAAQGIAPFGGQRFEPCRALLIDVENSADVIRATCRPILAHARRGALVYDEHRAWLWHRPAGLDLRTRRDRLEFDQVLTAVRPDVVCAGPLYKLYRTTAKEPDELVAAEVQAVLDDLRVRHNFALVLEHHAPHAQGGRREMRPFGSSLWLRWPEIGLALTPSKEMRGSLDVGRWRPDRVVCNWPDRLDRGERGAWPWQGRWNNGMPGQEGEF